MTKDVVTVTPSMEIAAAARVLTERRISGAPVVDAAGVLLGVVSQTDLARFLGGTSGSEVEGTPVSTVMTLGAVACDEDADEDDLAELMLRRRVHRILVTSAGRLCGIVTAMDLLRALLRRSDQNPGAIEGAGRIIARPEFDGNERRL